MSERTSELNFDKARDPQFSGGRFLCFSLGKERFAIPLLQVKEVIANTDTTSIPQAPTYFKGIMNLRGQIISVIDMTCKLKIGQAEITPETTIIILDLNGLFIGVIVDSVDFVLDCDPNKISKPPDHEVGVKSEYIVGVVREKGSLILMIDMNLLMGTDDITRAKAQLNTAS